jgi:hypothetical protein
MRHLPGPSIVPQEGAWWALRRQDALLLVRSVERFGMKKR